MDNHPGRREEKPGEASSEDARLDRMLAELERLRRAGIFTEEQFEDERRRLLRESGRGSR